MWLWLSLVAWAWADAPDWEPPEPLPVDAGESLPLTFTRLMFDQVNARTAPLASVRDEVRLALLGELRRAGHHTKGGENLLFGLDASPEARLAVGGTVHELALVETADEAYMGAVVRWEVFDRQAGAVTYAVQTTGLAEWHPGLDDVSTSVDAIREAFRGLLARQGFIDCLLGDPDAQPVQDTADSTWGLGQTGRLCAFKEDWGTSVTLTVDGRPAVDLRPNTHHCWETDAGYREIDVRMGRGEGKDACTRMFVPPGETLYLRVRGPTQNCGLVTTQETFESTGTDPLVP